jgi:hypothetical protein
VSNFKINLRRIALNMSANTIGTDALNAMSNILGVNNVQIISETNEEVSLTYSYSSDKKYWQINEHLAKFWLERSDL